MTSCSRQNRREVVSRLVGHDVIKAHFFIREGVCAHTVDWKHPRAQSRKRRRRGGWVGYGVRHVLFGECTNARP